MADNEVGKQKRRKVRAKTFLERTRGSNQNMAGDGSTGGEGTSKTGNIAGTPGGINVAAPGVASGASGLLRPEGRRNNKRTAVSPLFNLLKTVKTFITPKHKEGLVTPPHRGVVIDKDGMTHIAKQDGGYDHAAMIAHTIGTPLPRFDPDNELELPQLLNTPAIDPKTANQPLTLATLQQANRALLLEFHGTVKKELKIRDDYIKEMGVKLNSYASVMYAVLQKLSDYEERIQCLEYALEQKETKSQLRDKMLRDVVLLVQGLDLAENQTHENRVLAFLNQYFEHPHSREFIPSDISCAYSVGKPKSGKRTIKVVFQSAWLRRYVLKQRYKLRGLQLFINEELSQRMSKLGFEARVAKRNGLIAGCKVTPMGVVMTTHEDEDIEVDNIEELFDVLSSFVDNMEEGELVQDGDMEVTSPDSKLPKSEKKSKKIKNKSKKNATEAEANLNNEAMIQMLRDKGLLIGEQSAADLLAELKSTTATKQARPTTAASASEQV